MTDQEWYRRRAMVLNRAGRALTKDEHDRLTEGLGRPLTDDPVTLRKWPRHRGAGQRDGRLPQAERVMTTYLEVHAFTLHGPVWRSDAWLNRDTPNPHLHIVSCQCPIQLELAV